ncbi:extracellular solute-binding protein [Oligoflexus tunisiensis]|uniref:extracellular solute-binding protein n=1 Tax=Oligoflexus tunisiensis TaxID=708132 RepID=UPI000B237641|nr:extracellular solute-binding protein [Oligoflexus tunisiensis]
MTWKLWPAVLSIFLSPLVQAAPDATLTVYSERKEHLIKPVFDAYTKKTGVKVKYLTDNTATLIQRIKAEGTKSPADILLTVDAGNLWSAAQAGIFEEVKSESLQKNVPAHLRDPGNRWFGLSQRARTIVYNPTKVKPEQIKSFENLADPSFKKRLCLRSAKKVYNQSLVAMLVAEKGEAPVEKVVKGWVQNLAAPVFQDDTAVIDAVAAGQCDVGVVNTYYFGRALEKNPKLSAKLFFPAKEAGGVHVNVSGAGVLKNAPHKAEAVKFLEWLAGPEAQGQFAQLNHEYPVNPAVSPSSFVQSWGKFDAMLINMAKAGELQEKAIKLMDRAGYN